MTIRYKLKSKPQKEQVNDNDSPKKKLCDTKRSNWDSGDSLYTWVTHIPLFHDNDNRHNSLDENQHWCRKIKSGSSDSLNSLLKYIISLRKDEVISDEVLLELTKRATSLYIEQAISNRIESEVSNRLEKLFSDKIFIKYLKGL